MRRVFMRLTDSETLLGNVVLIGLALVAVLVWAGCVVDDAGLGLAVQSERPLPVEAAAPASVPDVAPAADVVPAMLLPDAAPVLPVDTAPAPRPDVAPARPDAAPAPLDTTPPSPCATLPEGADCGPKACIVVPDGVDFVRSYVCRAGACTEERFDCAGRACSAGRSDLLVTLDGCDRGGAARCEDERPRWLCANGTTCHPGERMCR